MPLTSAFTPPGHFAFSSRPSHGESLYRTLRDNFGDTFSVADDGLQQARLYAQAMCLAAAQYQIERAANNKDPLTASELLGVLERDYQVVPSQHATLPERRAYLAAIQRISRGNRREAIEDALRMLLGPDFIEYRTNQPDTTVPPWVFTAPRFPGEVGVFCASGAKKKVFSIDPVVLTTGVPIEVAITPLGGTDMPMAGETFCVDPDPRRNIEQVTIDAVSGNTITATFTMAHESGTLATRPHPYWISYQRYDYIIVSVAAASDAEKRRKVNDLMGRALRGVSQWGIMHNAGVLTCDDATLGKLDCTPVS